MWPAHRVFVFSGNALLSVLSMLAIWRVGAVFAPINFLLRGQAVAY
jgi:crotonobetaine/carnitine-CoA ligase